MARQITHFLEMEAQNPLRLNVAGGGIDVAAVEPFGAHANAFRVLAWHSSDASPKYLGDRYAAKQLNGQGRYYLGWPVVSADAGRADIEILAAFARTANDSVQASLAARCSGSPTTATGYFADLRWGSNVLAIVYGNAGVDTDIGATAAFTFAANTVYLARFRVRGTALKLRVWAAGTTEPGTWNIERTDSNIAAAGDAGAGFRKPDAGSQNYAQRFLWFYSFGTSNEDAPAAPKTWQDFADFLGTQDAVRCVLAEIDPLGQTSAGVATTARVCAANMPFGSQLADMYPNATYEEILVGVPEMRRKLPDDFRGGANISYGDLVIKNEQPDPLGPGLLDEWKTWNWDGRAYRVLLGHPLWRRVDFKPVQIGTVADIFEPGRGKIGFKVRGREVLEQRPFTTTTVAQTTSPYFSTSPNAAEIRPIALGQVLNAPLKLLDQTALAFVAPLGVTATISTNSLYGGVLSPFPSFTVRDRGVSLNQPVRTITSVDAGTDEITTDTAHGLSVGSTVVGSGALPGGMSADSKYYVKTVPAVDKLTLSVTNGGATLNLTSTTTGGTLLGRRYDVNAGFGELMKLVATPDTPLTYGTGVPASGSTVADLVTVVASSAYADGMLAAFKANKSSAVGGVHIEDTTARGAIMASLIGSVGGFWGLSRTGVLQLGRVDAPSNVPVASFEVDDLRELRQIRRILPAEAARIAYAPNDEIQVDGALSTLATLTEKDLYGKPHTLTTFTPSESGLSQPANHILRTTPPVRVTCLANKADAETEVQRTYNLFRVPSVVSAVIVDATGMLLELGDEILLTHPRDGMEDGLPAIVVGISENPARDRVELEVWRQLVEQFPVVSASDPFVSEEYYQ